MPTTKKEQPEKGWRVLKEVLRSGVPGLHIHLSGPPGIGKSHEFRQWASADAPEVSLNDDLAVQELLGHWIPKGNEFAWSPGPFQVGLQRGNLIINEVSRASGAVLDCLLNVLDASPHLMEGNEVTRYESVTCLATSNHSLTTMDPALQDRFPISLEVTTPSPSLIIHLNKLQRGLGTAVLDAYKGSNPISIRKVLEAVRLARESTMTFARAFDAVGLRSFRTALVAGQVAVA